MSSYSRAISRDWEKMIPEFRNLSETEIWQIINIYLSNKSVLLNSENSELWHVVMEHLTNTSTLLPPVDNVGHNIYECVQRYLFPLIFIIGVFGNVLSLITWQGHEVKSRSTSWSLSALSVSDTMVLLFGLVPEWVLIEFDVNIKLQSRMTCRLLVYLVYSFSYISAWLIVFISLHRYVVICKPFLTRVLCRKSVTVKCISLLVTFFLTFNTHVFWTVDVHHTYDISVCEGSSTFNRILHYLDGIFYCILPSVILIALNILMVTRIVQKTRRDSVILHIERRYQQELRLTKVLMVVSITFVITSFPISVVMMLTNYLNAILSTRPLAVGPWIARCSADMFMYLNHSLNFVLYSFTGSTFRNQLKRMLCKRQEKFRHSVELKLVKFKK